MEESMTIRYVSREEFDAIVKRNHDAIALRKRAKSPKLTLAEKVELIRQAKALEALNE